MQQYSLTCLFSKKMTFSNCAVRVTYKRSTPKAAHTYSCFGMNLFPSKTEMAKERDDPDHQGSQCFESRLL